MGNRHLPSGGITDAQALAELAAIVEAMRADGLTYPESSVDRFLRLEATDLLQRKGRALLEARQIRREAN
jgi:hypothetical protein